MDKACKSYLEDKRSDGLKIATLLSRIKEISYPLFKLFFAAFKAKTIFKEEMNRTYGSFFYSHIFTNATITNPVFLLHTEMDTIPFNKSKPLEVVRMLEYQWISDIKSVWKSLCYKELMGEADEVFQTENIFKTNKMSKNCEFVKSNYKRVTRGVINGIIDHSKKVLRFTLPGYR